MITNSENDVKMIPDALLVTTISAILTLLPVVAHQIGVLEHLPDPPGKVFDSDAITKSKAAYPMGIPDGLLGVASYSATLCLVLLSRRSSSWHRLLRIKLIADGSVAGFNVIRQITSFQSICSWCTGTAVATAAMLCSSRKLLDKGRTAA